MCGIFGAVISKKSKMNDSEISNIIKLLSSYSETRGRDSSGFAFVDSTSQNINVLKSNQKVTSLIESEKFQNLQQSSLKSFRVSGQLSFMGHSRLVTNGSHLNQYNNQPVVKDNIITVHNGILVNYKELWESNKSINQEYQIDTEVFNSLVNYYNSNDSNFLEAFRLSLADIEGTASLAVYHKCNDFLTLYTNNKSLYLLTNNSGLTIFASERYTLESLLLESFIRGKQYKIISLRENKIVTINFSDSSINKYSIKDCVRSERLPLDANYSVLCDEVQGNDKNLSLIFSIESDDSRNQGLLQLDYEKINSIRRCTKCILPETFPFIDFDKKGICNYCSCYKKEKRGNNLEDLSRKIERYRGDGLKPDCIIPFSGGRDSTFTLHFVKNKLGLNPLTFTYDWAMVTDLARRNIARACGKLGVENIIVAADIHKKRNYIRKNVSAWLRNPSLGMVPLFMAGDKHFFRYTQMTKKRTNIDLNIWGINRLENTDFKSGFAGVRPNFDKLDIYSLSTSQKLSLATFLGINMLKTPEYINDSLIDNLQGHFSRMRHPRKDFFSFFDYYDWNEDEINDLIISEYNWETAIDTNSTWRIGDGTASFYNYIYYRVAGFSEIDTFRSNQIREDLITRSEALSLSRDENRPRYENMVWYLRAINLPFKESITRINRMPTLY